MRLGKYFVVVERAEAVPDQEQAEHEAEIADAVDEKSFSRSGAGSGTIVPMTDKQIGTETNRFPEDEKL